MLSDTSELPDGIRRTSSPLRHFRRTDRGSLIRFLRPPIAREPFRHRELRRSQTRGNALVSGSRPVTMDAAGAAGRQEEPGTSMYEVLGRSRDASVHLGELALSTRQTLFGGSQQPFHGLRPVALYRIAVVIQTTVIEDTEIKLRRGVAAFACKKQVLYGAALHQSIQTTGRDGRRFRTPRTH